MRVVLTSSGVVKLEAGRVEAGVEDCGVVDSRHPYELDWAGLRICSIVPHFFAGGGAGGGGGGLRGGV